MIDADQLREGNIIININTSNNTKTYVSVDCENKGWIRQDAEFYEPVLITKELIDKTSLIILNDEDYLFNDISMFSLKRVYDTSFYLAYDNMSTRKFVLYLHELQNIFWALCLHELVLDLNLNEIIE